MYNIGPWPWALLKELKDYFFVTKAAGKKARAFVY